MNTIRKLSVGLNFPNGVMHYQTGKKFEVSGEEYEVSLIVAELTSDGKVSHNIYIKGEFSSVLWKSIIDMPVHIEYDINYQ